MSFHPQYLRIFNKSQAFVMRGDGPLPFHYRNYIAIMVSKQAFRDQKKKKHVVRSCVRMQWRRFFRRDLNLCCFFFIFSAKKDVGCDRQKRTNDPDRRCCRVSSLSLSLLLLFFFLLVVRVVVVVKALSSAT